MSRLPGADDDDGMTQQEGPAAAGATAGTASARPPLTRPRHGRMVFGVCAALGRSTDVDPVIYRVLFVVLTIFGGLGVLIYAMGWLFIPDESSGLSEAERLLHRRRHWHRPRLLALVVAIAVVIWLASVVHGGHNLAVSIVVIALLGYLVLRDRGAVATRPQAEAPTEPLADAPAPEAAGSWWATTQHPAPTEPPRAPPPPRAPRSRLGWITLSVALVVAGSLIAVREAGVHQLNATNIVAATVLVIGCGLLVGSVVGRARWLALPGGALAAALLALVGIGVPIEGGIGDRTWHPTNIVAQLSPRHRPRCAGSARRTARLEPTDVHRRIGGDGTAGGAGAGQCAALEHHWPCSGGPRRYLRHRA